MVPDLLTIETTPPGAEVFIRDYSDRNPKWEPLGRSPLREARRAQGVQRWKISLREYEMKEGALLTGPEPVGNLRVANRASFACESGFQRFKLAGFPFGDILLAQPGEDPLQQRQCPPAVKDPVWS